MKQLVEERMAPSSAHGARLVQRAVLTSTPTSGLKPGEGDPVGQHLHFAPHNLIFMEGDAAKSVFQLLEGAVMLYKLLPDGRRQVVELLGAGDVFGLLEHEVYDCSAETLSDVAVVSYERAMVERSPGFLRKLIAQVSTQICALHEHAMLLGRKTALERVASFVMRCIPGRGGYACNGPGVVGAPNDHAIIHLGMTRQEIADYLGLTLETVSRAFSELRKRGLVTLEKQDGVRVNNVCSVCQLTGAH